MKTKLSTICIFLFLIAIPAQAKEKLILDAAGAGADALRGARIEIWRLEPSGERQLAHKDGADRMLSAELALEEGAYEIFLEDKRTGLIYRLDDRGKGVRLSKGKAARIDASGFGARIREIVGKDAAERPAKQEVLKSAKGKRSVFVVEEPASTGAAGVTEGYAAVSDVHAPGELLVKFQAGTTLADRYQVMTALEAEARSKLDQLDVYRVKVSDAADLQAVIQQFADDPRLKYIEMNMMVSVPEPVVEGR